MYKRQSLHFLALKALCGVESLDVLLCQANSCFQVFTHQVFRFLLFLFRPVSYTHLDVYKRQVLQPIEKRVGAKLVAEMMENVTTPEQYELLEMSLSLIHIWTGFQKLKAIRIPPIKEAIPDY